MHGVILAAVVGAACCGGDQPIDDFRFGDLETALQTWVAGEGSPPVQFVPGAADGAVQQDAPFASRPELKRIVLDRRVERDLAAPSEFLLDVATNATAAVGHVTLYFRSGEGWFGCGAQLAGRQRQTLRFAKTDFRPEGEPAGWERIDGIRLAVWRGSPRDFAVRYHGLTARWHDIGVVTLDGRDGEQATSHKVAQRMHALLDELGLPSDPLSQSNLSAATIGDRPLLLLPYNPQWTSSQIDTVCRYVEGGGKVFVAYTVPPRLAAALGFRPGDYHRDDGQGLFAEIRFDADALPGAPTSARQASWNINVLTPEGHGARVAGTWYDAAGNTQRHPAVLISDRGAAMTHIVLGDDWPAKRAMLAAVLGALHEPSWPAMADAALQRCEQIGPFDALGGLDRHLHHFVEMHAESDRGRTALRSRAAGRGLLHQTEQVCRRHKYHLAPPLAAEARRHLVDAYLRAQDSPTTEGRAWWNHSGTGAYPGDWQRTARELREAGCNMVIPNLLWAGRAHFPSDVLPRSGTFRQHGDQIAQCLAACREHGIEVHVWKVNYNLSGAPREFVDGLRQQGRLQRTVQGDEQPWLCPSHPDNQQLEVDSMIEVAKRYAVDGLHFDYIRYPHRQSCYCDGCRQRFEAHLGEPVADWPDDCYRGDRQAAYEDWRCAQITRVVAAVHREAKQVRPAIKISAAVFGSYPDCRRSVGQDWVSWIDAGYLDFVCPMDYTPSDARFVGLLQNQLARINGRIPIYPGVGATATGIAMTPDRVVSQIAHARRLGAGGFTIFNLSGGTAESILPGLGLGVGSQPATPPHAK